MWSSQWEAHANFIHLLDPLAIFDQNITLKDFLNSEVTVALYEKSDQRACFLILIESLLFHEHNVIMNVKACQLNGLCSSFLFLQHVFGSQSMKVSYFQT